MNPGERPSSPPGSLSVLRPFPSRGDSLRGSETILIVDDSHTLRGALAGMLRQYGYLVLEACGPLEAQRLTKNSRIIHLLLMDFSSAEHHDFQLAMWFRATYPKTKVLVASDALWELDFDLGVSQRIALLAKPFTSPELARIVRQVLDSDCFA